MKKRKISQKDFNKLCDFQGLILFIFLRSYRLNVFDVNLYCLIFNKFDKFKGSIAVYQMCHIHVMSLLAYGVVFLSFLFRNYQLDKGSSNNYKI